MESYTLNIYAQSRGSLYQNRCAVPRNGPILTINNSDVKLKHNIAFSRVCVDGRGVRIAAGDVQGNVYVFDLEKNRFWSIHHVDGCSSFLTFVPSKRVDLIIASANCSISFVNSDSCSIKKTATEHKTCVNYISVDETGSRILSSSLDEAILWDLNSFTVLHKLRNKMHIGIVKAFILPGKSWIVSGFKDNSVFMWDMTLKFKQQFVCYEKYIVRLKVIDCTRDGKLIACGGKTHLILIWCVDSSSFIHTISIKNHSTYVRHIGSITDIVKPHIMFIMDQGNKFYLYDLDSAQYRQDVFCATEYISNAFESAGKIAVLTPSSTLKVFDLRHILLQPEKTKVEKEPHTPAIPTLNAYHERKCHSRTAKQNQILDAVEQINWKRILSYSGEYPSQYRMLIWSELLQLPRNMECFVQYEEQESYKQESYKQEKTQGFSIDSPTIRRAFTKIMSMLMQWAPALKDISYIPHFILPFVKTFHRNTLMCFELLVTIIRNWCQNWFLYLPFPPFNILSLIENLLLYHDRKLLHHFLLHDISPEIYGFIILKKAFTDYFKSEWLKLWDHIVTNPPSFIVFIVIAINTISREALLQCTTESEFKEFYTRQVTLHSVMTVLQEAYKLQHTTPKSLDPTPVIGTFAPLPKKVLPVFNRIANFEYDLQTLERQKIMDFEVQLIQKKISELEEVLVGNGSTISKDENQHFIRGEQRKNFEDMRILQRLRRKLLLQSSEKKDLSALKTVESKLKTLQELIHRSLIDQASLFDSEFRSSSRAADIKAGEDVENNNEKDSAATKSVKRSYRSTVVDTLHLRTKLIETSDGQT